MQALFQVCADFFKSFHSFTRRIFAWGMPPVFALLCASAFCRAAAGHIGLYDQMLRLAREFFICGRDLLAVVVVYALAFELVCKALALDGQGKA